MIEEEKSLTALLAEVMAEVGYVQKDKVNTHQKYRYASAEAVLKKVNAALSSRGICSDVQSDLLKYVTPPPGEKGVTRAVVSTRLLFRKGAESVVTCGIGEGSDYGDKAIYKANTGALKYAMSNAFLISWGDDAEADPTTDELAKPERKPSARAKRAKKAVADDFLEISIAAASDTAALEALKPRVKKVRALDKVHYDELVKKYMAREAELKGGE